MPTGAPPDKSNDAKPMKHHRQRPGSSRQQAQTEPIDGMPKTLFTLSKIQTMNARIVSGHPPPEPTGGKPHKFLNQPSHLAGPPPRQRRSGARPQNAPPERFAPLRGTGLNWWSRSGSNRRPPACKAGALPTELRPRRANPDAGSRRLAKGHAWPNGGPG